jgi:hypothetical protein
MVQLVERSGELYIGLKEKMKGKLKDPVAITFQL